MENFLLHSAKIVGITSAKNWSQVHTFSPEEPEKISRRGQILAVIGLSGAVEEISAVGKEAISRLHEEYYGDLTAGPFVQLKKALVKVKDEVGEEAKLDVVAGAVVKNVLYLAIVGEGRVLLQRNNKVVAILQGKEVVTASGHLKNGDLFLLGTAEFFKLITQEILQTALATGSADEAAEVLTPLVHSQEDGKVAAAVIIGVQERKVETERIKPEPERREVKRINFRELSRGIKESVVKFSFLAKKELGRRLFSLFQKTEKTERPQKTMMTVALILLLVLGISVIFGMRQRNNLTQEKQIAVLLTEARAKKEEGEAFIVLNPLKARELFLEAQEAVQKIAPDLASQPTVIKFKQELEAVLAKVWREHRVKPSVFFDLELIKNKAQGDNGDFSAGQIIILDKTNSSLYSLGVADRKSTILAGGEKFNGAFQVAAFLPKVFVLTEKGIIQTEVGTSQQKLAIATDKDWGEIAALRVFQGSLYLLDKKSKIWRYAASETGFGAKQEWLKDKADFSQAVGMAIDGAVWILRSDGAISKYIRGLKEAFGVAGLTKPFSNPSALYTDSDADHLYILDKGNSRIVVLAKSGEYDSEYLWPADFEGMSRLSGVVVSEKERKIFLLSGSKIYAIEIQQ